MQPRRRVVLELKIGTDSVLDLVSALLNLSTHVACEWGEDDVPANGCSGGPSSGYSYVASLDKSITHESYFEAVKSWKEPK